MKKCIISALITLILTLTCSITAFAAAPTMTLSNGEGTPGDEVNLTVDLSENPGIYIMYIEIDYDDEKLELTQVSGTGFSSGSWDYGTTKFLWDANSDSTYNGTVLMLTFRIKDNASGVALINIVDSETINENDENVIFNIISGQINILHEHSWGEWDTTSLASCESSGVRVRACSVCGESETESVPALGHKMTHMETIEATYESAGNIEYWRCDRCRKCFLDQEGKTEILYEETVIDKLVPTSETIASGTCGEGLTWALTDDGTLRIAGEGSMENYNKAIVSPWWEYGGIIKYVVVDDGVVSIGRWAFSGFPNLKKVSISSSVKKIGGDAFFACNSIDEVEYKGTAEQWDEIEMGADNEAYLFGANGKCGDNVFWNLKNGVLTLFGTGSTYDYEWNDGPWYLYQGVAGFSRVPGIVKIVIEDGVTDIGNYIFSYLDYNELTIPSSVVKIKNGAFYENLKVERINIFDLDSWFCVSAASLPFVGIGSNNERIICLNGEVLSNVTVPRMVVNRMALRGCTSVTEIKLSEGIDSVEPLEFAYCTNLKTIDIPDGVTKIEECAFRDCISLEEIAIPKGVTAIAQGTFLDCYGLKNAEIPTGVTTIGAQAFAVCGSLENISIPEGVTSIGNYAFERCTSLKSIELPATLLSIGDCAFKNCDSLEDVYFGGNAEQWSQIEISSENSCLLNARIHYQSVEPISTPTPTPTPTPIPTPTPTPTPAATPTPTPVPHVHDWAAWTVSKQADCTTEGEETRVCKTDSSHIETRTVPALGHDLTHITVKAETEDGILEYWRCERCGRCFYDPEGMREMILPISGDVDNDGKADAMDAAIILRYLVGIDEDMYYLNEDLDGDGEMTPADAAYILAGKAGQSVLNPYEAEKGG